MPEFEVEISTDLLNTYISICSNREISNEEMLNALTDKGVVYGVDSAAVNILYMKTRVSSKSNSFVIQDKFPVAHGVPAELGEDAFVEWFVNIGNQDGVAEDLDGYVNFKETNLIKNVKKGSTIAVFHQAKKGRNGMSVLGKPIVVDNVKNAKLKKGKGVMVSADGAVYMAETDGAVTYKNDTISISEVFAVPEDVDFSTGNVSFVGSVMIGRDVVPGFEVHSEQDVEIRGSMTGLLVKAGGSITVREGISSTQAETTVEAGVNISSKYIAEAKIIAGGNVIVDSMIKDCNIRCNGSIIAPNGKLYGGKMFANRGVFCKILGNEVEVTTTIASGEDPLRYDRYLTLKTEIAALEKELENISAEMEQIKNEPQQFVMVKSEYDAMKQDVDSKKQEMFNISGGLELTEPISKIAVLETIFPGVKIEMRNCFKHFMTEVKGPVLIYFNNATNAIMVRNLSGAEITVMKKRFNSWLEKEEETV